MPVAHAVGMKESFKSMSHVLKAVEYEEQISLAVMWSFEGHHAFAWISGWICQVLLFPLLVGQLGSRTPQCCKGLPVTDEYTAGKSSGTSSFIAYKAGPNENFVKALDKNCDGLKYLKQKFPKLSDAKLKENIFVCSQIRKRLHNNCFKLNLNSIQLAAWHPLNP
jgi:hypothetical protein